VTRVAFIEQGWAGGRNYLRNLFLALRAAPDLGVNPVLLMASTSSLPADWAALEIESIRSESVEDRAPTFARRVLAGVVGEIRPGLTRLLRHANIDVLSHSGPIGRRRRPPSISWIPDFQHRRLPHLFSEAERAGRDAWFELMCRLSERVIVSSEDARADFEACFPGHVGKVRVLHFVDVSTHAVEGADWSRVRARYGIPDRYLLLPNQFWAHKNHRVVVDALALLRGRGEAPTVVATGPTEDYRDPSFFPELMADVRRRGVADGFQVLGSIPYDELVTLMRRCVAIVNPSSFEGWSTSVEESKSLGKSVILSDIPVHREQSPAHATYFDPSDAAALADALSERWRAFDPHDDEARQLEAAARAPQRARRFAEDYAEIVHEVA
jgi:glycosyltransferase involved in cell wall biosynthesis